MIGETERPRAIRRKAARARSPFLSMVIRAPVGGGTGQNAVPRMRRSRDTSLKTDRRKRPASARSELCSTASAALARRGLARRQRTEGSGSEQEEAVSRSSRAAWAVSSASAAAEGACPRKLDTFGLLQHVPEVLNHHRWHVGLTIEERHQLLGRALLRCEVPSARQIGAQNVSQGHVERLDGVRGRQVGRVQFVQPAGGRLMGRGGRCLRGGSLHGALSARDQASAWASRHRYTPPPRITATTPISVHHHAGRPEAFSLCASGEDPSRRSVTCTVRGTVKVVSVPAAASTRIGTRGMRTESRAEVFTVYETLSIAYPLPTGRVYTSLRSSTARSPKTESAAADGNAVPRCAGVLLSIMTANESSAGTLSPGTQSVTSGRG